jgi:hypothetical protein
LISKNEGGRNNINQIDIEVHIYNPSYSEGKGKRIPSLRPAWTKLMRHGQMWRFIPIIPATQEM